MTKNEIILLIGIVVSISCLSFIIGLQKSTIDKYKTLCNGYEQIVDTYKFMIGGYEHVIDLNEQITEIREANHG